MLTSTSGLYAEESVAEQKSPGVHGLTCDS